MSEHERWQELGQQLRVDAVRCSGQAASGHPTSSMSAADLMAVLIDKYLHYDFAHPDDPSGDHLIFSKGHASPLLYAIYRAVGAVSAEELAGYRTLGSRLEGHPTPDLPWVDVATGSLGQGLPIAVGVAWAAKNLDRLPYRSWVLCGDSEMAEGSMWEAFEAASYWGLDNLCAVIDVNRLGQSRPTRVGWDLDTYARRAQAFGWHTIEIDGHDVGAIDSAYAEAEAHTGEPTVIVARTHKGKGLPSVDDQLNAHGKPVPDWQEAIEALGGDRGITVTPPAPRPAWPERNGGGTPHRFEASGRLELPTYEVGGDKVATRKAYGEALAALGSARPEVVGLDGEVSNSTYSEIFAQAHPERFVECYIAECQMIATAVGLQVRHYQPWASTFAAFLTRAYDFVRMAAVSQADICVVGSHSGCSIGEDGPSQMGLEDLAAFRAVHGSTVVYPCDANQTAALVGALAEGSGIRYLRTTRGATPVIYEPTETFAIGGAKVVRSSDDDAVCLVGAGITLHEALAAADALAAEGIAARVVDAYSVKPIDAPTLSAAAAASHHRVIVVEDHWPEGGLGDAVREVFADADTHTRVVSLAVTDMPGSGKPDEVVAAAGIDA
ncbi:MAG: transketolase, partial [Acidimicrobiales bacterium]